ncbi:TPA: hypothetical protein ACHYPN_003350 [Yersinia enterocolitica]|nr:hypothetical protein [Yersinia enterocolitica]ELW8952452.1 hypothetical protein [Yersinia enterocolitica]HDL8481847.1 hypothetical protein [Yersinia enterocolitica]
MFIVRRLNLEGSAALGTIFDEYAMKTHDYALITPTYRGHFDFIKKYLSSLNKFSKGEKIPIYLTVEEDDVFDLEEIASNYKNIDVRVLSFEMILSRFDIRKSTSQLLEIMGRFSYQTLKKLYTILYINESKSLIVDSESMMIRDYELSKLFDEYFRNPFISYSKLSERKFNATFTKNVIQNSNFLLKEDDDAFFLENFIWFYDKKIVKDLCDFIGTPYEMVMLLEKNKKTNLFEIQIYHHFIYANKEKYGYKSINVTHELKNALSKEGFDSYMKKFYGLYKGNCGILERVGSCVSKENINDLSDLFHKLKFNIIRSEYSSGMKYHSLLIRKINPVMLCASQEHSFGINNSFINRWIDASDTRWEVNIVKNKLHSYQTILSNSILYRVPRVLLKMLVNPIRKIFK